MNSCLSTRALPSVSNMLKAIWNPDLGSIQLTRNIVSEKRNHSSLRKNLSYLLISIIGISTLGIWKRATMCDINFTRVTFVFSNQLQIYLCKILNLKQKTLLSPLTDILSYPIIYVTLLS